MVPIDLDEPEHRGPGDRPDPGGERLDAVVLIVEWRVVPDGVVAAVLS